MIADLPAVNVLVRVRRDGEPEVHRSRVESIAEPQLLIAAPELSPTRPRPVNGDRLSLQRSTLRGACTLLVLFESHESARVPVWRVSPYGELQLTQRRRYARASAAGPVSLLGMRARTPATGSLVDVSEGGLRCRMPTGSAEVNELVHVNLQLDGEALELPGEVLLVQDASRDYDEVVVVFDADGATAEGLRRYVFARQRHERRMGRA